ncbi:MAG: hypothetical protein C0407_16055 [Desulfobacca sp.]|nr:hypothetical protein [Desulfobacca sp.]
MGAEEIEQTASRQRVDDKHEVQGASYSLSVKKKSGFIVLDLESGQILHAQEGKDARALVPFLEKLKRKKVPLLAIAMDMSPAYLQAVRQVFPKLDIAHDPYHVVSLVNKAIDETRWDIARELNDQDKQVIKGSRFLFLLGLESLNAYSLSKLMDLMEVNEPLYAAYFLNEDMRTFWNQPNEQSGEKKLLFWKPTRYPE